MPSPSGFVRDYIARISGSEFAMLMPQTTLDEAQDVALSQHAAVVGDTDHAAFTHAIKLKVSVSTDPFALTIQDLLASTHGRTIDTDRTARVSLTSQRNDD